MESYRKMNDGDCPNWWEGTITVSLEAAKECERERVILQKFKDEAKDLLYKFWQRTSDACPLEATEAERQEIEFSKWVSSL